MRNSGFLKPTIAFAALLFLAGSTASVVQGAPTPPASLKCKAGKMPTQVTKRSGKIVWKCAKPTAALPAGAANATPSQAAAQPGPTSPSPTPTPADEQARIDAENARIEEENAQAKALEEERKRLEEELKQLPGGGG